MPIIAISRGRYSGGARLGEELHKLLGWRVVSQAVLTKAAEKFGVTEDEMQRAFDIPANIFERFTRKKLRYILASQAILVELFEDGNGIFQGLAGALLFEDVCNVFKVKLTAPIEMRVADVMVAKSVTREQALRFLHDADQRRDKLGRQLFGAGWNDADHYDHEIDLGKMTFEDAARTITKVLESERYKPTPKCEQEFKSFALGVRVRAELFFNSSFNHDIVEVSATEDTVRLTGGKAFEATKNEIVQFVRAITGVERVFTADFPEGLEGLPVDLDFGMSKRDMRARDVMLPPTSYPHLNRKASIRDAVVALSASAVRLEDGHFLAPRYVLILDDERRLVGVVTRRDLLEGLVPDIRESRESMRHIQQLVPFGGEVPREIFISWTSLFSHRAATASEESVATVMQEVRGTARLNDSLSTVISTMLHHGIDLLPVLDGEQIAGVVVMTNIFDIVAQFIMEHGGKSES